MGHEWQAGEPWGTKRVLDALELMPEVVLKHGGRVVLDVIGDHHIGMDKAEVKGEEKQGDASLGECGVVGCVEGSEVLWAG